MKWTTWSAIFGTILIVVAIAAKLSGIGTAEVPEPNEPNDLVFFVAEDTSKEILTVSDDVVFTYCDEAVVLDIIDGVIICDRPPKKAIEIIFKTLYSCYGADNNIDVNDLTVRFPEPNEPELTFGEAYWSEYEPNDPVELETFTNNDPNEVWFSSDNAANIIDFGKSETLSVNDTDIYLKNIHLLDKDELRDFALFVSCATSLSYVCDEYYEGILRLVPDKLLQEPNEQGYLKLDYTDNEQNCLSLDLTDTTAWDAPGEPDIKGTHDPSEPETTVWDRINPNSDIILFAEPNEPNDYTLTYDATKGKVGMHLNFIPTWPNYIELEKDLWIVDEEKYGLTMRLIKGTKIYFKE